MNRSPRRRKPATIEELDKAISATLASLGAIRRSLARTRMRRMLAAENKLSKLLAQKFALDKL